MTSEVDEVDADRDAKWSFAVRSFRAGDKSAALTLFKSLAREGEYAAFREIGNIYEIGGNGVEQDYKQAMHWYQRSFNEANDVQGSLALARLYYLGRGTDVDYEKAFTYYSVLEKNDHPLAMFQLGQMYYLGQGVDQDFNKASYYYQRSVDQGHLYALKFLGHTKFRQGQKMAGLWFWFKGIVRIIFVGLSAIRKYGDPRKDPRLRTC